MPPEKPKANSQAPNSIRVAQTLFFLNAAIWLLFGGVSLIRMASGNPAHAVATLIIALFMFGNVGAMLVCGVGLGKRQKRFYVLAIAVLVVNIILTVTDEFGIFDLITLIIDLGLLGLLIATRRNYTIQPR